MSPLIRALIIAVTALLTLSLLVWGLAFRVGAAPPPSLSAEAMQGESLLSWHQGWDVKIESDGWADEVISRGIADALGKPWPLLLLRRAALGGLAEWYGDSALPFDAHIARLGIPERATAAVGSLPPQAAEYLDRYASGINSALPTRRMRLSAGLAGLAVEPQPWEAWHSIAIEQLLAWLGAERSGNLPGGDSDVNRFFAERDRLAGFLGLEGLRQGALWTDDETISLRLVYGSSGMAPVTVMDFGGGRSGLSFIGVPYLMAGIADGRSWAVLPIGRVDVMPGVQPEPEPASYRDRAGGIHLVERRMSGDTLGIGHAVLIWPGFRPVSDAETWRRLESARAGAFQLVSGAGFGVLADTSAGATRGFLGSPDGLARLIAPASYAGALLATLTSGSLPDSGMAIPRSPIGVAGSSEAGALISETALADMRRRIAGLGELSSQPTAVPGSEPGLVEEGVSYARNWDGSFAASSISASIHEALLTQPTDLSGVEAFAAAIARLSARLGNDPRTWRWENSDRLSLIFPGDPLPESNSPFSRRYSPVPFYRSGHPTALVWGASVAAGWPLAPAAWEGYFGRGQGAVPLYRVPFVPFGQFLGRTSGPEHGPLAPLEARAVISQTRVTP